MILLSVAISIALVVTIALPIAAVIWLNKKRQVSWRVILYGALAYFIVQILMVFLFGGFTSLVEKGDFNLSDRGLKTLQLAISVIFAGALGVFVRWAGMKYVKEDLDNLKSAYGIGVGYGGIESLIGVGLPLLMTFITMLRHTNLDIASTPLDGEMTAQIISLWEIKPFVPLAGSVERLAAMIMHITVTVLVLQVFTHKRTPWLAAAFGLEIFVNGIILGLAEAGVAYGWVILVALLLMAGNLFVLYRLTSENLQVSSQEHRDQDETTTPMI